MSTPTRRAAAAALVLVAVGIPLALRRRRAPKASTETPTGATSLPRLVDFGSKTCAPCKAMSGVLDELGRTYRGRLIVEFVNVHEQEDLAARFAVQLIPTQVFLSADGRELYRHTGFLDASAIVEKWGELGYRLGPPDR